MGKKKRPSFSQYIREDLIHFLEVSNRNRALEQMVDLMNEKGIIKDKEALLNTLLQREDAVSTAIGMGIAIPHAKLTQMDRFYVAIGLLKGDGIEWDSLDGTPVKAIFLIIGPEKQQMEYLKILSCLTIAIKKQPLRKQLFQAKCSSEVKDLFEGF